MYGTLKMSQNRSHIYNCVHNYFREKYYAKPILWTYNSTLGKTIWQNYLNKKNQTKTSRKNGYLFQTFWRMWNIIFTIFQKLHLNYTSLYYMIKLPYQNRILVNVWREVQILFSTK